MGTVCLSSAPPRTNLRWRLVERPAAVLGAAQAGDLLVLDGELVVVCDLLVDVDGLPRVDDDLLLRLHRDHLGVTVGLHGGLGRKGTEKNKKSQAAAVLATVVTSSLADLNITIKTGDGNTSTLKNFSYMTKRF